MHGSRFDVWSRRRFGRAAGGLTATLLGLAATRATDAAAGRALCTRSGEKCREPSATCQPANCLRAPFTITASWSDPAKDHDTYLFVPNAKGSNDPAPHIDYSCNPDDSECETAAYPFVCVSQDAQGPGDEVTTVRELLSGRYEYWIELDSATPADALTVVLRTKGGKKLRSWTSPANPSANQIGWHVFDISGTTGIATSINKTISGDLPDHYDPNTFVCAGALLRHPRRAGAAKP